MRVHPAAAEAFSRSRLMYARVDSACGEAGALAGLGAVHRIRGELDTADGYLQQALSAYVSVGDRHGQAYAHGALGMVWLEAGRDAYLTESRRLRSAVEGAP